VKKLLRTVFYPVLMSFEKGDEAFEYKSLNRKILIFMGVLFLGLAAGSYYLTPEGMFKEGYFIPVLVFGTLGGVAFIVGTLGTDRAVTKIWGMR